MHRRSCLKAMAAAAAAGALPAAPVSPIQLHVDLDVDPANEKTLIANFRKTFRPAISKQPGFVEVRLLKMRTTVAGFAPQNTTHRLLISFETEEQRQAWVSTETHQRVWPSIESNLRGAKINAVLYDVL